jgi:hypothetical protein
LLAVLELAILQELAVVELAAIVLLLLVNHLAVAVQQNQQ